MDRELISAFMVRGAGDGQAGDPITFVASTEGIKRDGIDLRVTDWYLDNFRKNPVFLWVHDYWGRTLPLGLVEAVVEGDKLMAYVRFDQADDFARQVERKYRDGFLHTVSVGWNFIEIDKKRRMDLLDVSGVPVPGDPDALVVRQFEAERELQTAEDSWDQVSAAMVALYNPLSDEADEEREAAYKRLLPKYRKLGKVAPEYMELDELKKLTPELIRGLFISGESVPVVDTRAGASLSSRNREDLQTASELILGVLERTAPKAAAEAEEEQSTTAERGAEEDLLRMATIVKTQLIMRS